MMKMKWRNPFLQFALGVIGIAHAFSSGFATPRQTTQLFVSVLEERDDSIANYLNGANVETMQALLQLEEEKQMQIQALRMQLYQDLNTALRERELQSMRVNLDRLRQQIEVRLELQSAMEALKANEIQRLQSRLEEIINESQRIDRNDSMETWLKSNFGSLFSKPAMEKAQDEPVVKSRNTRIRKATGAVKKENPKKNATDKKSTVKLGPFTQRD